MPRLKALSQQVQALFGQGRYVEARALYTQILADSPDSISAPQHTHTHTHAHTFATHTPHTRFRPASYGSPAAGARLGRAECSINNGDYATVIDDASYAHLT